MARAAKRPETRTNGEAGPPSTGRVKPSLGPPKVVVHGAWGRALPAPRPGEKEESIFTSWLMGLLGKPHPRALEEDEARSAARR
jgi:hypothetical protein